MGLFDFANGVINTSVQWGSAAKNYAQWGLSASIKYCFPTLKKFKTLNNTQRDTFDTITNSNLKTYIENGNENNAKLILDAIAINAKIETAFAKLDDETHLDIFLKLSTKQIDTFLAITDDEVSKYAESLDEVKAKKLLDAMKSNTDLSKLDKNQIETLTNIADDEVRKYAESLNETKAKKLLDAMQSNADLSKLDKNQIETLTNIADDDLFKHAITLAETDLKTLLDAVKKAPELGNVWKVLEVTKGDGATHFAKFLKLDSTEAKNYLDIITGKDDGTATATATDRDKIKTKLVSLTDDKIKQFLTDFKALDTEKLLALNTKDSLIDIWKEVKHIDSSVIATTRNQIPFLESIDWLKNTTDGQHVSNHIFVGDLSLNGSGVIKGIKGVHHKNAMKQQVSGTDTTGDVRASGSIVALAGGFYQQLVEVYNGTIWKKKIGNGGMASFFPDSWTEEQVHEEIAFAELNAIYQNNIDVFMTAPPENILPISATFKTSGVLLLDGTISTVNNTTNANDITISNSPFPYHVQGQTHNLKVSAPINVTIDASTALQTLPIIGSTNTVTFLGSTYKAKTSNGGNCQMFLYNPAHSTKIIGSAFPCP